MKLRGHIVKLALGCGAVYFAMTVFSLMIAHALLVWHPGSSLAESIIAPVARALEFIDVHWKSALLLVGPFILPVARDLIPRLRKAWGLEFDVALQHVGKGEVPSRRGTPQ